MKKALMISGLIVLTGVSMALTSCCAPGHCRFCKKEGGQTELCKCGYPKGSEACKAACMK